MSHNITGYQQFVTKFDRIQSNRNNRIADYKRGLETGLNATEFHIAVNGVWSTRNKNGSSTFSCEQIGYHANTVYFMVGIMLSGVEIFDHRLSPGAI